MIQKRETCLYCGEKMESKTAKKKFCSPKCKVYWNRESEQRMVVGNGILRDTVNNTDLVKYAKGTADLGKNDTRIEIKNTLERLKGESSIDYRIRLAEWKEKQLK